MVLTSQIDTLYLISITSTLCQRMRPTGYEPVLCLGKPNLDLVQLLLPLVDPHFDLDPTQPIAVLIRPLLSPTPLVLIPPYLSPNPLRTHPPLSPVQILTWS